MSSKYIVITKDGNQTIMRQTNRSAFSLVSIKPYTKFIEFSSVEVALKKLYSNITPESIFSKNDAKAYRLRQAKLAKVAMQETNKKVGCYELLFREFAAKYFDIILLDDYISIQEELPNDNKIQENNSIQKTIVLGLCGSGKSTMFREMNERNIQTAAEIEIPRNCMNDENLKVQLLNLWYNNSDATMIIMHPYFLPANFEKIISHNTKFVFLDLPFKKRKSRILKRAHANDIPSELFFPDEFLLEEEINFNLIKERINNWQLV